MADLLTSLLPGQIFRALKPWLSWPSTCVGLGTIPLTNCGGNSIPRSGLLTHNPWVVLQTVSRTKLEALAAEPVFQEKLATLVRTHRQHLEGPAWFFSRRCNLPC